MPGIQLCMAPVIMQAQRIELRQEPRLEQRLEIALRQALLLPEERGYGEQREVLQKIMDDVNRDVYSDIDNFYQRVMKRIKKDKRTAKVRSLVKELRDVISEANARGECVTLDTIADLASMGLRSIACLDYADETFSLVRKLSGKEHMSVQQSLRQGITASDARYSAKKHIENLLLVEGKTKGEATSWEWLTNFLYLEEQHSRKMQVAMKLFENLMRRRATYDRQKMTTAFACIDETCGLAVADDETYTHVQIGKLLGKKNYPEIIEKYADTPVPLLCELVAQGIPDEIMGKLNAYAGTKHMRGSRDYARSFLGSVTAIKTYKNGRRVIDDIVRKSTSVKQAKELLSTFASLVTLKKAKYDFSLPDAEAIDNYLKGLKFSDPVIQRLSDEAIEKLKTFTREHPNDKKNRLYNSLIILGEIYQKSYPEGLDRLAKLMEDVVLGNYQMNRYRCEEAKQQLSVLGDDTVEWEESSTETRLVGDLQGVKPKYDAVMKIVGEMRETYKAKYGSEISQENISSINIRINELIALIQKATPETGKEKRDVLVQDLYTAKAQKTYAEVVDKLSNLTVEELPVASRIYAGTFEARSDIDYRAGVESIIGIVDSDEVKSAAPLQIRETDDPILMMDVGINPRKSCQRWTEETGHNRCLPAYLLDANKRLIQVLDLRDNVRVRSIERLLEADEIKGTPLIFVEAPYADLVSEELYKALIGGVVRKAGKMVCSLERPVAIGAADEDYRAILKEMAKDSGFSYEEKELHFTLPKSRNLFEYSDGLGGDLKSESKVSAKVGYLTITSD